MGVVYEAEQLSLRRRVALKVLPFAATMDPRQLQRFKNEAQAAAQLHHTHIVPVHYVGSERGVYFYAMQFVEGQSLAAVIAGLRTATNPVVSPVDQPTVDPSAGQPIPPTGVDTARGLDGLSTARSSKDAAWFRTVTRLGIEAAEALDHAHQRGVVHRDVKPANLLVDATGHLWVTDFGLAQMQSDARLTITGDLVGTLRYMSPEQALAKRVVIDHRTDVYSLGATLYELLTLEPAFTGTDRQELLRQIAFEEPRPPRRLNRTIPAELETIVLKALEKNPAERYATAQELADDLRRFQEHKPIRARRPTLTERLRKWAARQPAVVGLLLVSGLAALALVGVGVALLFNVRLHEELDTSDRLRQAEAQAKKQLEDLQYIQKIDRAQAALRDGNFDRVATLLDACPAEQRHWEWHYLKQQGHATVRTFEDLYADPEGKSGDADLSPDGKHIAFSHQDGTLRVCEATTGREILTVKRPLSPFGVNNQVRHQGVAFSPDGTRLASTCDDWTIRITNATTGAELYSLEGHSAPLTCMAFSPDGRRLAAASWAERSVRIWDVTPEQQLSLPVCVASTVGLLGMPLGPAPLLASTALFRGRVRQLGSLLCRNRVQNLAFSPDGTRLAAAQRYGSVEIWEVSTLRLLRTLQGHTFEVWAVAFSPDGTQLASAGWDQTVKVWDVDSGQAEGVSQPLHNFQDFTQAVSGLAFSPDGTRLAAASINGIIKSWDMSTRTLACSFTAHAGITKVQYSLDGTRLLTFGGGAAKIWDATTDPGARLFGQVPFGQLSPDGQHFGFVDFKSPDQTAKVVNATTGQLLFNLLDHKKAGMIRFSPDGTRLATVSWSREEGMTVKVREWPSGKPLRTLRDAYATFTFATMTFSPDGKRLATINADGRTLLWDLLTGQPCIIRKEQQYPYGFTGIAAGVVFSPDGHRLAIFSWTEPNRVVIYDVTRGDTLFTLDDHKSFVWGLAYSPDGKMFASTSFDATVKIWDPATFKLLRTLKGHSFLVFGLAFTPDSRRLITTCRDGTVKVWDPTSDQDALLTLPFRCGEFPDVMCHPDGKQIYLVTGLKQVKIFDARPLTPEIRAEREALGLLQGLFTKPLCQADVRDYLHSLPTITPEARRLALELVEGYQEETDPERYYQASWALLRQPYLNAFQYRYALRQAETACRLAPWQGRYQMALGLARYRNGKYAEALDSFTRAEQRYRATAASLALAPTQGLAALNALWQADPLQQPLAAHLAFLAMTQQQLGQTEKAQTTLEQLRQLMAKPDWAMNAEVRSLLREAEAMVRGAHPN
jgi:WD40 repeat protein/serine/threonine protein kinase